MELIFGGDLPLAHRKKCHLLKIIISIIYIIFDHFANGENGRFRTNIQKTLEIEQVFVPSQYLVGAGNHICRTPNALKTS